MRRLATFTTFVFLAAGCSGEAPHGSAPGIDGGGGAVSGPEQCGNGLDDDGDGQVDEGCACVGEKQACYGGKSALAGKGICNMGEQECTGNGEFRTWGTCTGWGQAATEIPGNGKDDDCDGVGDAAVVCTKLTRVSSTATGEAGDGDSWISDLSGDGRIVLMHSSATNLTPGASSAPQWALLAHDQNDGSTARIDATSMDGQWWGWGSVISADGRYVAYHQGDVNGNAPVELRLHDRQGNKSVAIAQLSAFQWNRYSGDVDISSDGRYVSYHDFDQSQPWHLRLHDQQSAKATTIATGEPVTTASDWWMWGWGHALSSNGRYVAYYKPEKLSAGGSVSQVNVRVHDRDTGKTATIGKVLGGGTTNAYDWYYWSGGLAISADGRYVAYYGGEEGNVDPTNWKLIVHDRDTGKGTPIADATGLGPVVGDWSWGRRIAMSDDGRYLAFYRLKDTWDLVAHDRQTGQTAAVVSDANATPGSVGADVNGGWWGAVMSADGRCIGFSQGIRTGVTSSGDPNDPAGNNNTQIDFVQAFVTPNPVLAP